MMTTSWLRIGGVCIALMASAAGICPAAAQMSLALPDIVVTPTGRPERLSRVVGTMQIITQDVIQRSTAKSVTDLLAENAVGFMSEWTPGQTSLNIRGAATEGQGRDFRSQVLVLINGHRAGTANISKLSPADIERIEIVRGPSSVVYGSQNLGGVVNLIMKNGRSAPGHFVDIAGGSWNLLQGRAQRGGKVENVDYYVGLSGGKRDAFHIGGGAPEQNTAWSRAGATGAIGAQINEFNRVDLNIRSDGVYDAGFRGSSSNIYAVDDRFNRSYDLNFTGQLPDGRVSWLFQNYAVQDVDDLNNPSPLSGNTSLDRNRRQLNIVGTRFQPRVKPWEGNDLLLGHDWEQSWIRSTRLQLGLNGLPLASQAAPTDNNQSETVHAFYFEDAQTFLDRWTIRGGVRRTFGTTNFDPTPRLSVQPIGSRSYQVTTYSGGSSFAATDWLTFRVGTSTGFRAPTATDLSPSSIVTFTGNTIFGNPSLKAETSTQYEAGFNVLLAGARFDAVVFQNTIKDRILTQFRSGSTTVSDTINNPGDIVVRGVELQADTDMIRTLKIANAGSWRWNVFGNGYYHFDMEDKGAAPTAITRNPQRVNAYGASIGTRFGQTGNSNWHDWNLQLTGILRGPMWYDTEEAFLIPQGEPNANFIHRKPAFWVANARGEVTVKPGVTVYAAVNNIFDINQHPIFIALDQSPCLLNPARQNGACGNSMPGREFIVGLQSRW